jgi:inorganic triphosphatase YgiF
VKVTRHTWKIRINESELELAFDQGTLLANEKSRDIQEIELELLSGRRLDLWLASQELSDHLARSSRRAFIESRSKAQRGMGLLDPAFLISKSPKVRASGDTASIIATHLQRTTQWLSLEIARVLESEDPEGTHSARVAIRQLRTSLKLLEACGQAARVNSLIGEAKWLADSMGKLRDLDVAVEKVVNPILAALQADQDLLTCQAAIESRREAIRAELRTTLTQERSRDFLIQLFKLSEELPGLFGMPPADQIAQEQSALLLQKVKKRRKRAVDPESRHRLRLAYKALRYATPILVHLGGDERLLDAAAKDAAKQQDTLGDEQDRAVMWATLSAALLAQMDSLREEQRQRFLDLARGFLIGLSTSDQG